MKLNCDLGENSENWYNGHDKNLLNLVDMVNISCGAHAGDEQLVRETLQLAIQLGKEVGAHPSYPDKENFGRKTLPISSRELHSSIYQQLSDFNKWSNGKIDYVKPHGALYHDCMTSHVVFEILLEAMNDVDLHVPIMLLSGFKSNYLIIPEAFLDRRYENENKLVLRSLESSIISEPKEALNQYIHISEYHSVIGVDGKKYEIEAESLCIHSDTLNALAIAEEIVKYKQFKAD
jgi:UPF0271 protein